MAQSISGGGGTVAHSVGGGGGTFLLLLFFSVFRYITFHSLNGTSPFLLLLSCWASGISWMLLLGILLLLIYFSLLTWGLLPFFFFFFSPICGRYNGYCSSRHQPSFYER